MVEAAPSGARIEAGSRLLTRIAEAGVPVEAAAWIYDDERERWLLTIVSDRFSHGLAQAYDLLSPFLAWGGRSDRTDLLNAEDVAPVPSDRDISRALIGMEPLTRPTPRPVSNQFVSGVFVPQAVLYRVAA